MLVLKETIVFPSFLPLLAATIVAPQTRELSMASRLVSRRNESSDRNEPKRIAELDCAGGSGGIIVAPAGQIACSLTNVRRNKRATRPVQGWPPNCRPSYANGCQQIGERKRKHQASSIEHRAAANWPIGRHCIAGISLALSLAREQQVAANKRPHRHWLTLRARSLAISRAVERPAAGQIKTLLAGASERPAGWPAGHARLAGNARPARARKERNQKPQLEMGERRCCDGAATAPKRPTKEV